MPCSQRPKVFCHCFHVRHIAVWIVANRFFVRDRLGSMAIVTRFPVTFRGYGGQSSRHTSTLHYGPAVVFTHCVPCRVTFFFPGCHR
jgi:hypothetical protein